MAEHLDIQAGTKKEAYEQILPQLKALIEGETNLVANLANISAALKQTFHWFWVGFYIVEEEELILGPFQGEIACTRIRYGKGVCGTAWKDKQTLIVPNVDEFPGHIACSALSKSEIVVPIIKDNSVRLILDVDSSVYDAFDETDKIYLEQVAQIIEEVL